MWFTKQTDGYRAWFALKTRAGTIRTGATAGDFTVTVVDPTDTNTSNPSVSESSAKAGLYTFLIPTTFLTTNGNGLYGVVVEVNTTSGAPVTDVLSQPLSVSSNDFDTIGNNTVIIPALL